MSLFFLGFLAPSTSPPVLFLAISVSGSSSRFPVRRASTSPLALRVFRPLRVRLPASLRVSRPALPLEPGPSIYIYTCSRSIDFSAPRPFSRVSRGCVEPSCLSLPPPIYIAPISPIRYSRRSLYSHSPLDMLASRYRTCRYYGPYVFRCWTHAGYGAGLCYRYWLSANTGTILVPSKPTDFPRFLTAMHLPLPH